MKLRTLIIIVLVVVLSVGFLFYFLSRNGAAPAAPPGQTGSLPNAGNQQFPTSTPSGNGTTANQNSSSSARFGIISNEPAITYFVSAQNQAIIIGLDGEIKTITNNQASVLSSSTFQNIASAALSYDGKKAMVNFVNNSGSLQTDVFDVPTKSWTTLPMGMQNPIWSPVDYQIAYLQSSGAGSEIISTINAGGATIKPSAIGTIMAQDITLQWPNKATLIISDRPSVYVDGSAWSFNIPNQTIAPVALEYPGLETIWSSTTGTVGLVFSSNAQNSGGHLLFVDAKGAQKTVAFTTLPSKCGFSTITTILPPSAPSQAAKGAASSSRATSTAKSSTSTTSIAQTTSSLDIYCAVPRDQQTLAISRLPDEYEQKIIFTSDDFYKINITDGTLNTIFNDQNQTIDATQLKVFNNTLFFINRYDQKLYALSL